MGTDPSSNSAMDTDPVNHDGELQLFLQSVGTDPLLGVAARIDRLGLSRRKGNAIKNVLIEEGYLSPIELIIPSGKLILLELSETGRHWLQRHRHPIASVNGSLPHAWWQHRLCEILRQNGWTTEQELTVGKHTFDVHAQRGDSRVLVEVESGRSDWLKNLSFLESARGIRHKAVLWLDAGSLLRAQRALPKCITLLQPRDVSPWIRSLT
jgi:hypothetical protein